MQRIAEQHEHERRFDQGMRNAFPAED